MKSLLAISLFLILCNFNEKLKDVNDSDFKLSKHKPFFDFDEVVYYKIPIGTETDIDFLDDLTEEEKLIFEFVKSRCPTNDKEEKEFFVQIKSVENYSTTIDAKYYDEFKYEIFSEKECNVLSSAKCVPIYRDIFIFKKDKKAIGIAKICFDCSLFDFSSAKGSTECFNMNNELKKLKNILSEINKL